MNPRILLDDYERALQRLSEAVSSSHSTDLERAGCIQYFEFCFELAWKTIKKIAEQDGVTEIVSPRAALKYAFGAKLIAEEDVWLTMLDARNAMSHTYNADEALEMYKKLPEFNTALSQLLNTLKMLPER
jgi:nucleotidyltransferase substrate binding protein (TIGR01987 family)